jgi:acyl-CoA reductase-like NAD-dependent aldehyde dehydrogenase
MTVVLPFRVRTRAFINGDFTDAVGGATFDSLAPASGEVVAQVAACSPADVDRAVGAALAHQTDYGRAATVWSHDIDGPLARPEQEGRSHDS